MKDLRPWWAQWREVYFELSRLSCPLNPWEEPLGYDPVYSDGDHSFKASDIGDEIDCVEEQLWAFRNGLSDIAFTITIKTKRPRRV